jgi:hypothetical protein
MILSRDNYDTQQHRMTLSKVEIESLDHTQISIWSMVLLSSSYVWKNGIYLFEAQRRYAVNLLRQCTKHCFELFVHVVAIFEKAITYIYIYESFTEILMRHTHIYIYWQYKW